MKPALILFGIALSTTAAFAQSMAELDADGDGAASMAEVQALFPDVTEEAFTAADTDGDGMLNEEELTAAQDAGVIPSN